MGYAQSHEHRPRWLDDARPLQWPARYAFAYRDDDADGRVRTACARDPQTDLRRARSHCVSYKIPGWDSKGHANIRGGGHGVGSDHVDRYFYFSAKRYGPGGKTPRSVQANGIAPHV